MLVGYMRVSTDNDRQVMDLQRDALLASGFDGRHSYEDRASGSRGDRSGLAAALAFLQSGDCLVVWKLDRLGRSLPHLLATVNDLKAYFQRDMLQFGPFVTSGLVGAVMKASLGR